jgi:hypothetical protein
MCGDKCEDLKCGGKLNFNFTYPFAEVISVSDSPDSSLRIVWIVDKVLTHDSYPPVERGIDPLPCECLATITH